MSTVFTRRFGGVFHQGQAALVLFTADELHVYVVRDLVYANLGTAPAFIQFFIQAGPSRFDLLDQVAVPVNTTVHFDGRQELLPSEQLFAFSDSTSWSAVATGYALTP